MMKEVHWDLDKTLLVNPWHYDAVEMLLDASLVDIYYQRNDGEPDVLLFDYIKTSKRIKPKKRSIGTQTKVLGFWERLFTEIRCLPIDENDEW